MEFKTRKDVIDRIDFLKRIRFEYARLKENDPVFESLGKEFIENSFFQIDRTIKELNEAHDKIPLGHYYKGTLYVLDWKTKEPLPITGTFFLKNGLMRWKRADGSLLYRAVKNKECTDHLTVEEGTPFYTIEEFKDVGGKSL